MRTRDVKIAEQFGIIARCKAFEADLLEIKDIVPDKMDGGIGFDLTGFLSDIYQVIIIPKYDIRADRDDYWEARRQLRENIVALAKKIRPASFWRQNRRLWRTLLLCVQLWEVLGELVLSQVTTQHQLRQKKGRYHHAEYHQF